MKQTLLFIITALMLGAIAPAPAATVTRGPEQLEAIKALDGVWDAPTKQGVMTDVFHPFAMGTKVLAEEWINGKQITSTVFYVVNGELRVDHYCDYLNEPRYTAKPSLDPAVIDFEFRDATNIDTHPAHFHSTTWHIVNATHLVQDWYIEGGTKGPGIAHMEFTKRPGDHSAKAP